MLGIAHLSSLSALNEHSSLIGTALSVAGYEETHEVSGNPIDVYRLSDEQNSGLMFIRQGNFEVPDEVVVYKQLEQGAMYPKDQLWWRPLENFSQHFTPIENPT